ncbi:MAG TPA: cbb3-type cytochrome oxidase assembly protein CcoS [Burkholderiaceae bacterium]|nr:cbb3-type cytochrome oxidase assembly protein CcoS [Burkholderiaceae bacterium]
MESLYWLIPLSVLFVLLMGAVLVWAAMDGQFEALEQEGQRLLGGDGLPNDPDQRDQA